MNNFYRTSWKIFLKLVKINPYGVFHFWKFTISVILIHDFMVWYLKIRLTKYWNSYCMLIWVGFLQYNIFWHCDFTIINSKLFSLSYLSIQDDQWQNVTCRCYHTIDNRPSYEPYIMLDHRKRLVMYSWVWAVVNT